MNNFSNLVYLPFVLLLLFSCSNNITVSIPSTSRGTTPNKETNPKTNNNIEKVVSKAKSYVGTKYKYGGSNSSGMDCSGLVCQSYSAINLKLPRTSREQSSYGKRVYIGELQKGDLIFFGPSKGSQKITHVGLISFANKSKIKFMHSSSSRGVMESELSTYWKDRYIKATRPL